MRLATIAAAVLAGAYFAPAGAAVAASAGIEMTGEIKKACAKAEARYKEVFPNANDAGVVVVKLYKFTFCPPNLKVKVGATVRWVNVDKRTSHSVWLKESGVAESERFFPEEKFEFTFPSPGTFPYLCGPHGEDDDMRGTVEVTP